MNRRPCSPTLSDCAYGYVRGAVNTSPIHDDFDEPDRLSRMRSASRNSRSSSSELSSPVWESTSSPDLSSDTQPSPITPCNTPVIPSQLSRLSRNPPPPDLPTSGRNPAVPQITLPRLVFQRISSDEECWLGEDSGPGVTHHCGAFRRRDEVNGNACVPIRHASSNDNIFQRNASPLGVLAQGPTQQSRGDSGPLTVSTPHTISASKSNTVITVDRRLRLSSQGPNPVSSRNANVNMNQSLYTNGRPQLSPNPSNAMRFTIPVKDSPSARTGAAPVAIPPTVANPNSSSFITPNLITQTPSYVTSSIPSLSTLGRAQSRVIPGSVPRSIVDNLAKPVNAVGPLSVTDHLAARKPEGGPQWSVTDVLAKQQVQGYTIHQSRPVGSYLTPHVQGQRPVLQANMNYVGQIHDQVYHAGINHVGPVQMQAPQAGMGWFPQGQVHPNQMTINHVLAKQPGAPTWTQGQSQPLLAHEGGTNLAVQTLASVRRPYEAGMLPTLPTLLPTFQVSQKNNIAENKNPVVQAQVELTRDPETQAREQARTRVWSVKPWIRSP